MGWLQHLAQQGSRGRQDISRAERRGLPKELVLKRWSQTCFLREEGPAARGWLIEVMKCIEETGRVEFEIADIYQFEERMRRLYPGNLHVREKMRQQLQLLRDKGFIEFLGRGRYRRRY